MFTERQIKQFEEFKRVARETANGLRMMSILWDEIEINEPIKPLCGDSYPFDMSFDEAVALFISWVDDFEDKSIGGVE